MKDYYYLNRLQLKKICDQNRFLALRYDDGSLMGVNCKVASLLDNKGKVIDHSLTNFVSAIPISFQEYITLKRPFL
jgi:hypothetical protein